MAPATNPSCTNEVSWMYYVIAYDISDTKRRNRFVKTLSDYAYRAEYSVFEMKAEPAEMQRLLPKLKMWIDETEDSLLVYEMGEAQWKKHVRYGLCDDPDGHVGRDFEIF